MPPWAFCNRRRAASVWLGRARARAARWISRARLRSFVLGPTTGPVFRPPAGKSRNPGPGRRRGVRDGPAVGPPGRGKCVVRIVLGPIRCRGPVASDRSSWARKTPGRPAGLHPASFPDPMPGIPNWFLGKFRSGLPRGFRPGQSKTRATWAAGPSPPAPGRARAGSRPASISAIGPFFACSAVALRTSGRRSSLGTSLCMKMGRPQAPSRPGPGTGVPVFLGRARNGESSLSRVRLLSTACPWAFWACGPSSEQAFLSSDRAVKGALSAARGRISALWGVIPARFRGDPGDRACARGGRCGFPPSVGCG